MQEEVTGKTVTLIVNGAKMSEQPHYLVFFKSRDADAITAAFQEFASRRMGREEKPAIRDRLEQAKEQAERKPEHRTLDREKVKTRDRSVQR